MGAATHGGDSVRPSGRAPTFDRLSARPRVAAKLQPAFRAALMDDKVYDAWRAEVQAAFESAKEVAHTKPLGTMQIIEVSAGRSFDAFKTADPDIPFDAAP